MEYKGNESLNKFVRTERETNPLKRRDFEYKIKSENKENMTFILYIN